MYAHNFGRLLHTMLIALIVLFLKIQWCIPVLVKFCDKEEKEVNRHIKNTGCFIIIINQNTFHMAKVGFCIKYLTFIEGVLNEWKAESMQKQ